MISIIFLMLCFSLPRNSISMNQVGVSKQSPFALLPPDLHRYLAGFLLSPNKDFETNESFAIRISKEAKDGMVLIESAGFIKKFIEAREKNNTFDIIINERKQAQLNRVIGPRWVPFLVSPPSPLGCKIAVLWRSGCLNKHYITVHRKDKADYRAFPLSSYYAHHGYIFMGAVTDDLIANKNYQKASKQGAFYNPVRLVAVHGGRLVFANDFEVFLALDSKGSYKKIYEVPKEKKLLSKDCSNPIEGLAFNHQGTFLAVIRSQDSKMNAQDRFDLIGFHNNEDVNLARYFKEKGICCNFLKQLS